MGRISKTVGTARNYLQNNGEGMTGQGAGLITDIQLMEQLDIKDRKTIARMIRDGDLPQYTFGSRSTKIKGWHVDVLRDFHLKRYASFQNVGQVGQVTG